ncbi:hypothetical protein [Lacimicrobium alkaliphilum]|uniref:Uncharacterized protein n=1 Tax=Lacimicrobium alkaliphilum TaxID=1526571 RepID=A0A0U3ABJ7_9ALTE|nr:hypothetical protein [Lacimicrobium alkaliphilum]ALS98382.1 hypothetical protein AT746_09015 [Lacimicrobium alkaliphilum]
MRKKKVFWSIWSIFTVSVILFFYALGELEQMDFGKSVILTAIPLVAAIPSIAGLKAAMIDRLKVFSNKFQWLKPLALIIGGISLAVFLYGFLCKSCFWAMDQYLIPAGISLLWSGALYWFLVAFPDVPDKPSPDERFFSKLSVRFKRFVYLLFALTGLVLTMAIVVFTVRGLRIWL